MASVFNNLETIKKALEQPRFGLMTEIDDVMDDMDSKEAPAADDAAADTDKRRR